MFQVMGITAWKDDDYRYSSLLRKRIRVAITCLYPTQSCSLMYISFVPFQFFSSCTVSWLSSSLALIGPKVISQDTVSSGIHLGSRESSLQRRWRFCSLAPMVQLGAIQNWWQLSVRVRKLGNLQLGILHIKDKWETVQKYGKAYISIHEAVKWITSAQMLPYLQFCKVCRRSLFLKHVCLLVGKTTRFGNRSSADNVVNISWQKIWLCLQKGRILSHMTEWTVTIVRWSICFLWWESE